jgi:hypothetical protein
MDEQLEALLHELEIGQRKQLMGIGRRIVPNLTEEDVLQPNDYPELENNPYFRYEEGVLAGIQTVHMALRAAKGI